MLLEELVEAVGSTREAVEEGLSSLLEEGVVRRRLSKGLWIYWLDGDGPLDAGDWEMVEALTVLQVLEEASRLA